MNHLPDQKKQQAYLRFVFVGLSRPWTTLVGSTTPGGSVVELRSLPGDLSAWGDTLDEAMKRLQLTVDAAIAHANAAGQTDLEWYQSAFKRMCSSAADAKEFQDGLTAAAEQAQPPYRIEGGSTSFEFVTFSQNDVATCDSAA